VLLGKERCDAIVVTGEGTGMATPIDKVKEFRSIAGDFPLIIGAGVTLSSLRKDIPHCDGFIVGSWFKENHSAEGEVCEAYVREFMAERNRLLAEMDLKQKGICDFTGEYAFFGNESHCAH